jgi:hypothetical protein
MAKMRFTLDTNCIIDVEDQRPNGPFIQDLVKLHGVGDTNVAVSAIGASERLRAGGYAQTFDEFRAKLERAGFGAVEILLPILYWGIGFWGHGLWADENDPLERQIHDVLFPRIEFAWPDYANAHRLPLDASDKTWRNAKCDVLGMWCHIKHRGDAFVTSDENFHATTKRGPLQHLGVGRVLYPRDAFELAGS